MPEDQKLYRVDIPVIGFVSVYKMASSPVEASLGAVAQVNNARVNKLNLMPTDGRITCVERVPESDDIDCKDYTDGEKLESVYIEGSLVTDEGAYPTEM